VTVDEFIHRFLLGRRHSAYPVEGGSGNITGLVSLAQLRNIAPGARTVTRLDDVAVPIDRVTKVAPHDPVLSLLGRLTEESGGRALVFDGSRLVGIVTLADVARAIETRSLRATLNR
jgi:CBS domain-containing protein